MSVTRTALIVMRIMNAMLLKYPAGYAMVEQKFARFAKKANLTDADIVAIGDVLIAISLMTNANVATVRDPSLYDPAKAEQIQECNSKRPYKPCSERAWNKCLASSVQKTLRDSQQNLYGHQGVDNYDQRHARILKEYGFRCELDGLNDGS